MAIYPHLKTRIQKFFAFIANLICIIQNRFRYLHINLDLTLKFIADMKTAFTQGFQAGREDKSFQPMVRVYQQSPPTLKWATLVMGVMLLSNVCSYFYGSVRNHLSAAEERLYLVEKASVYVTDLPAFEMKVKEVSDKLDVPHEWLMAVMYSESRFDAKAKNFRGSGAVGLIQFMPGTARDMGTSTNALGALTHTEQLDWVFRYMQMFRNKYGEYENLTDFYLAILYPKARGQGLCYVMYAAPSQAYKQNIGLDIDKDGRVTVGDIDRRMRKLYPTAYKRRKSSSSSL